MEPPTQRHDIGGVTLDDDEYTVKQSYFRNKYKVYDEGGNLVLKSKQKLFKMKEEFPFFDADGNTVFRVKAKNVLDVAGDYVLVDERTDEPVIVLSKDFTIFHHHWTIKTPDGAEVAEVESRSAIIEALRSFSTLFSFLPHRYTISGPDGNSIGEIEGRFSLRDVYDISVEESNAVSKTALVAAAIAIDALEGN
ncbi:MULTISPECIES: LURP-one-related family protein [unclassified Haladaptatus]|uniref:LURP-one-related/scramblase family protein n=1 Tax=unclassified Haladaptatus TaxID=2622732 RepID=UPI00209C08CC|nr:MULTISPECIES: LURP-one-related family protein [unclassified Haladaptatus]MCO8246813.1 LURP-one-related family protein [Haladaptatus sp. AB643]MCO8253661.1 LURP-one-related family protein [Haladaptatus sp. AB618]